MSAKMNEFPKAFAVPFSALRRWDPPSFHEIEWHWSPEVMAPIGSVLTKRQEKVDPKEVAFKDLQPVTVHFDGSVSKRGVEPGRAYTMALYRAHPGDIVVAKIDLKNGAVGIIPDAWENVVFTNHFAIYEPDLTQLIPAYLRILVQAPFFKRHLWRNKVGAEGRKEVKLEFFEALQVPIPPLPVQRAIIESWNAVNKEVEGPLAAAAEVEDSVSEILYEELGTKPPNLQTPLPKLMALPWAEIDRWSYFYQARKQRGLVGFLSSRFPIHPLGTVIESTMNGRSIKPTTLSTPYRGLKLSALTPAGFNPSAAKPVEANEKIAEQYSIEKGDLLVCRSNSFDYVAKCAVVEEGDPFTLFPDIMIRVRFSEGIVPHYVREVVESPLGRSFFQTQARRAAGAMWKIGAEDIREFPVPLPPEDEQRSIVGRIAERRAEAARLRALARQRRSEALAEVEEVILGTRPVTPTLAADA